MKFRDRFKKWKENIAPRHIYSALTILLVCALTVSLVQVKRANAYHLEVENQYNRAFHELVDYVRNVDMSLAKGLLVSSPSQITLLTNDIWRDAAAAQANLGQLPVSQYELDQTERFLSQVGDYCYMLSKKAANQEELTEDEYAQMQELANYSATLYENLRKIQDELYAGTISFGDLENASERAAYASDSEGFGAQLEAVEKEFQDYPSLIYDGPFSSHLDNLEPMYLRSKAEVSEEQAREKAKEFLGDAAQSELEAQSGNTGNLETYSFSATGSGKNENIMIDVTKKGGVVLWMTNSREIDLSSEITMDDAIARAQEFLTAQGYPDMKSSYYQKSGGSAVINFAYSKDGVIYYPDLIKVKVALDNGEIIGFEARGYVMRHYEERQINPVVLSQQEAQAKLNSHLTVESCQLALIPLENQDEVLCYEFKGKSNEKDFIVYINTETGEEENILILLETPDGTLTM